MLGLLFSWLYMLHSSYNFQEPTLISMLLLPCAYNTTIRPCKLNNQFLVQVNEQNQARHKAFFNFFLSKPIGVVNFNTKLSSTRTVKHLTEYKLGVKTLKSLQM